MINQMLPTRASSKNIDVKVRMNRAKVDICKVSLNDNEIILKVMCHLFLNNRMMLNAILQNV